MRRKILRVDESGGGGFDPLDSLPDITSPDFPEACRRLAHRLATRPHVYPRWDRRAALILEAVADAIQEESGRPELF